MTGIVAPIIKPTRKHPIIFTTKFEYKEIKEKFLYNISLIPNLETAPKAPPKPTNIIFKSIMI